MLDEIERSVHDALCVVKRVMESRKVVAGGGAVEAMAEAGCVFVAMVAGPGGASDAMAAVALGRSTINTAVARHGLAAESAVEAGIVTGLSGDEGNAEEAGGAVGFMAGNAAISAGGCEGVPWSSQVETNP